MKKGVTIFMLIAIISFLGFAFKKEPQQDQKKATGITFFKGTWQEALTAAKEENKLIFMDAYAVWCGPCKTLTKRMTKPLVGEFYNDHFINVKMDMEKHAEGPRLARKFKLRAYPTLYFINPNEELVKESVGLLNEQQLLDYGNSMLKQP